MFLALSSAPSEALPFSLDMIFWVQILSSLIAVGLLALLMRWRKVNANQSYPRSRWLYPVIAAFPLILVAEYFLAKVHPIPQDPMMIEILEGWAMWQSAIAIAILAPLAEEYVFRGALLVWIERKFSGGSKAKAAALFSESVTPQRKLIAGFLAALITSAAWAIIHTQYDMLWIGVISLMGMVMAYIRLLGGSLWITIALHVANNSMSLMLFYQGIE